MLDRVLGIFSRRIPRARGRQPAVRYADLLRRPAVNLDTPETQRFLAGKVILVTGAGGSIGSEICRQIMRFCPSRLVMLEQAEGALFEIDSELRRRWVGANLIPCVADICDVARVRQVFAHERPAVIFHCAAHKHVPMMEANPGEAIKNNVFGTKAVADAAAEVGAAAFVMVSTDKAVNPTSVMGAAKRCAEMYVQSMNRRWSDEATMRRDDEGAEDNMTRFVAVRFGNVLGSSGSVVPTFQKQIAAGGPVTVTHPEMRRYFMTIPEASQLVLQAGAIACGGEIFILDMGEPIRILDLAADLIQQSGLRPGKDIAIAFTGIRPGEKLYEELAADNERTRPTSHSKIRVWQLPAVTRHDAEMMLHALAAVVNAPREQIITALSRCVPEYQAGERAPLRLVRAA